MIVRSAVFAMMVFLGSLASAHAQGVVGGSTDVPSKGVSIGWNYVRVDSSW